MNDKRTALTVQAAHVLAAAIGAGLKPDAPQPQQTLEGLAFLLARMTKRPEAAVAVGRYAARYMDGRQEYAPEGVGDP